MKTKYFFFVILFTTINFQAKFDSVIFKKYVNINYAVPNVYRLGDINKDGYDDILFYDCSEKTAKIFLGGNPMDTIPKYNIHFNDTIIFRFVTALDINGDGINDIVISTIKFSPQIGSYVVGDLRVFYGGSKIDTIPDLIFHLPPGAFSIYGMTVLKDFNGDGRSELVIYDAFLPFESNTSSGINYFYNTAPLDTVPHFTIRGDSTKALQISAITSSGDINGDGKTDFAIEFQDTVGVYIRPY